MTREDIDIIIKALCPNDEDYEKPIISPAYLKRELEALALEQEPCDDAISRQAVLDYIHRILNQGTGKKKSFEFIQKYVEKLPSVNPQEPTDTWSIKEVADIFKKHGLIREQEPKTEQFARWVAKEIFDDNWEYNKESFAELACRKLAKLGMVIRMGDEWELFEPQESDHKCHTCKHYTRGRNDGSCGSYICEHYSNWESEDNE